MPTVIKNLKEIREIPLHPEESETRSHHILNKVLDLLERKTRHDVIEEIICDLRSE